MAPAQDDNLLTVLNGPNVYLDTIISAVLASSSTGSCRSRKGQSEIDNHANMVVLGSQCFVIEQGGTCDVSGFAPGSGRKAVRVVDAAVAHDDPYTGITHILLFKNALYCPDMDYNLIPPFILREAGLIVNETPKFHCKHPTIEDHSIYSEPHDLRIHLQLHGTFSYFDSRKPTVQEIKDADEDDLIWFTPDQDLWDPYLDTWQMAEASMIDENGELQAQRKRKDVLIPISEDENWMPQVQVSSLEAAIDNQCDNGLDPTLDGDPLYARVSEIQGALRKGCKAAFVDDDDPFLSPIFTTVDELERTFGDVAAMRADKTERASPEFLSKIWSIKIDEVEKALEQNTILYNRSAANDLSRRAVNSDRRTRYRRIRSNFFTDTFFVDKKATTKDGFNCMQLFVSDKGFVAVYPMKSKSDFPKALKLFCKEVGVPERLVVDGAREQTSREVKSFTQEVGTTLQVLEESTQWANRAELYIGLFKKQIRKDLQESKCPMILWDYCARRRALINNLTPKSLFQLQGRCAHEVTTGSQGDMSNLLFGWYEWVKYTEISDVAFPAQRQVLGRCLGPTKNEGNTMSQTILTAKGTIVPRRTVRPLTPEEIYNEDEIKEREKFDKIIQSKYGTHLKFPEEEKMEMEDFIDVEEEINDKPFWIDGDPVSSDGRAQFEQPVKDLLVGMELNMPQVDEMRRAKVLRKSVDSQGETVGEHDANPLISTLSYDVQFDDGEIQQVGANIIAQNLYSQIDGLGNAFTMLEGILDHDTDGTQVKAANSFITTPSGAKRRRKSTQGWSLKVLWNDGSKAWVPLSILKESNPIEVAEYAKAMGIIDDPSFVWWAPHVLKKRDYIISKVEARVKKVNHKYGIEVPKNHADAVRIDIANENTFWQDAIKKEMETIKVAFKFLEKGSAKPEKPWEPTGGHLVFDVKMDFTRKARWVKNGYLHDAPTESTFAGVVSRETVRLCLTYAALNDLNVLCCDFQSAYLQSKTSETHYIICGPEFGEHEGCYALIKRALYGGKSAGADYWKTMRSCMECLHFKPCKGDQDLWMRPAVDNEGNEYWEYVCLYTDDALVISVDPE